MKPLKIFGWASDHQGCGNYRIGLPMWALSRFGHDALAFSVLNVELPDDLDILVGQLVAGPQRSAVWQELAARKGRSFGMIFEMDDDVWSIEQANPSYSHYAEHGETMKQNIRVADAITVTNDRLAEVVSEYNDNVFVLPNCFDAAMLDLDRPRNERLTVGWAGGSSHHGDFASAQKDIATFFRKNPDIDSHFMGVNYSELVGRRDGRFSPWQQNLVEYMRALDFDLGIAPLAYNRFNRSKSDLKFVEYASVGIPVVASDFGPYADSIQHGLTGMKVKHPHEWARYLNQLAKDEAMRTEIGDNARAWASTRTIQANFWRWEDAYRSVLGVDAAAAVPTAEELAAAH
ncbi:MAG TPA: glycosyltransferase [Jatrophihabitans sp.]